MLPTIRTAVPSDAAALARVGEDTFRETFEALNTPEDMQAYCASAFNESVQYRELTDPSIRAFVAEHEGQLVAYAMMRRDEAPPAGVAAVPSAEVMRLYVRRAWHGSGLAHAFMSRLLDAARQDGARSVWLGVWEHNARALRFYGKYGFTPIGDHVFMLGSDAQRDLIAWRMLDAGVAPPPRP